jgi:hypothetical protein
MQSSLLTSEQLDAGMYSGRDGFAALPYFDEFDLSTIDVLLISQYVFLSYLLRGVPGFGEFKPALSQFKIAGKTPTRPSSTCATRDMHHLVMSQTNHIPV